jgi:hypothetical protein
MLFNSFISDIPLGMWDLLKKKTIAKCTTHLAIVQKLREMLKKGSRVLFFLIHA